MTTCWLPDCSYPATGRGTYPLACWTHSPEEDDRYPVLVEYTHSHVVWVAAPSQEDAVRYLQSEPYESTNDNETLVDSGWTVEAPKKWDWNMIQYGGIYYQGTEANAHVEAHKEELRRRDREAKMAACTEAGHPDAEASASGRWCPVCYRLPAVEAVAS